jgi:hypothetical protein
MFGSTDRLDAPPLFSYALKGNLAGIYGIAFQTAEKCPKFKPRRDPWVTTMRSRVRRFAHVLERSGLAMAGAACGLFVAAHVGSSIAQLTSEGFVIIMMIGGAIGFYLGIDTPPLPFHVPDDALSTRASLARIDSAELLSAVGTFLAAMTAFVSVSVIVFREDPHIFWTVMIMLGWVVGVTMQIIAGTIARTNARAQLR